MIPQSNIRNFSIIAHIDHGKTTLTDRLLLATDTITQREFHERHMDSNPIEQERGITIKLAPVSLKYQLPDQDKHLFPSDFYLLNLIDTPGHVDFGYEVSRSLAACEGALLLVDATQGIQAQTLSNLQKARDLDLKIIVALNKVDLPAAEPDQVTAEITSSLDIPASDILQISAKTGQNVDQLLIRLIKSIPPPTGHPDKPAKALIFNSAYHPHKGVIAFVKLVDGSLNSDQSLTLLASDTTFAPKEIGLFSPAMKPVDSLSAGQVGYIATGLKAVSQVRSGDTITLAENHSQITPLPGYKEPQPVVFMDLYPQDAADFTLLKDAIEKLALNDASLQFQPVSSQALSKGFRVGFLGALHAEIALERLNREYDLNLIPSTPTVVYKVTTTLGEEIIINNPSDLPDPSQIQQVQEPITQVTIFTPQEYLGAIFTLLSGHRGDLINQTYLGSALKLEYLVPLSELITGFYDQLKSASQGYASLQYSLFDYQPVDVVKLSILINHEPHEALSQIVLADRATQIGRKTVKSLKDAIPRQLVEIPIQAAIGGQIVARETIKAYRKDVTAKLYGGDITRRKKLLQKQKKGKAKRAIHAKVEIPQSAYLAVLKQ